MECWYPAEDAEARAIVATHDQESIQSAVAAIKLRPNRAGKKTSPVPALVAAELEHKQRERDAAVRRTKEDAELRVRAINEIDPAVQAIGEQLLPANLRARLIRKPSDQQEAAA